MLDKTRIDKKGFHYMIEETNQIKISNSITDIFYNLSDHKIMYKFHEVWIIGLYQDNYDNYYIIFDDYTNKIDFVSCVYKIEDTTIFDDEPDFNAREKRLIEEYIDLYFKTHKKSKLLYLNI